MVFCDFSPFEVDDAYKKVKNVIFLLKLLTGAYKPCYK